MPRQRSVSSKKTEEQPTLHCPHCRRKLTGKKTGYSQNYKVKNVFLPTIEMDYPCEHCGIIVRIHVATKKPEPEVVDFGAHYVTDEFELRPLS